MFVPRDRLTDGMANGLRGMLRLPWCEAQLPNPLLREMLMDMQLGAGIRKQPAGHIAIPERWWTMSGLVGGMAIAAGLGIGGAVGYGIAAAVGGGLFWLFRWYDQHSIKNKPSDLPVSTRIGTEQAGTELIPTPDAEDLEDEPPAMEVSFRSGEAASS